MPIEKEFKIYDDEDRYNTNREENTNNEDKMTTVLA